MVPTQLHGQKKKQRRKEKRQRWGRLCLLGPLCQGSDVLLLGYQLLVGGLHTLRGELVDGDVLYNGVLAVLADHGEGVVDVLLGAVGGVLVACPHTHRGPLAVCAEHPIPNVFDRGVGCRGCAGGPTSSDDGGTPLLYLGDEGILDPCLINQVLGPLALDLSVGDIGVLGGAVVAPDGEAFDFGDEAVGLLRELGEAAIVVESGHGGELAGVDVRSSAGGDQCVGVGGVTDHNNTQFLSVGVLVEGLMR